VLAPCMIALGIFLNLGQTGFAVLAHSHGECDLWTNSCGEPEYSLSSSMLQRFKTQRHFELDSGAAEVNSGVHASSNSEHYSEGMAVGKHVHGRKAQEQHGIDNKSSAVSNATSNITDNDVIKKGMLMETQSVVNHEIRNISRTHLHAPLAGDMLSNSSRVINIGQDATKYMPTETSSALKLSTLLQTVAFSLRVVVLHHASTSRDSNHVFVGLLVLGLLLLILCSAVTLLHERRPNQDQENYSIIQSEIGAKCVETWTQTSLPPLSTNRSPKTNSVGTPPEPSQHLPFPCMCSELIVPGNRECTLYVPNMPFQEAGSVELTVDGANGVPIFKTISWLQCRNCGDGQTIDKAQVKLLPWQGEATLAYCQLQQSELQPRGISVLLHRPTGAVFGELRPDAAGYAFSVHASSVSRQVKLNFNEHLHSMAVVDETGRLLALIEKTPGSPTHRLVRIGPLMDSVFVIMSLFGVDLLQACESHWGAANIQHSPLPSMLSLKA